MKFLLVRREGGGCDYTIGCGIDTHVIEAEDMDAALAMLKADNMADEPDYALGHMSGVEYGPDRAYPSFESATLYAIPDKREVPISEWCVEWLAGYQADEKARAEDKERAELARLKEKYA